MSGSYRGHDSPDEQDDDFRKSIQSGFFDASPPGIFDFEISPTQQSNLPSQAGLQAFNAQQNQAVSHGRRDNQWFNSSMHNILGRDDRPSATAYPPAIPSTSHTSTAHSSQVNFTRNNAVQGYQPQNTQGAPYYGQYSPPRMAGNSQSSFNTYAQPLPHTPLATKSAFADLHDFYPNDALHSAGTEHFSSIDPYQNSMQFQTGFSDPNYDVTDADDAAFSPSDTESPKKRRGKGRARKFCIEPKCKHPVTQRAQKEGIERCQRCQSKHEKYGAPAQVVVFDPTMTFDKANSIVHAGPKNDKLEIEDSVNQQDLQAEANPQARRKWLYAFIQAVNKVYNVTEEDAVAINRAAVIHQNYLTVQDVYTRKFFDQKDQYNNEKVNARMFMVVESAVRLHLGLVLIYDDGGDNSGYSIDRSLRLPERLQKIRDMLELDKRIVMDIVEGRGVNAFVRDPWAYEKRKQDNVNSNAKKKIIRNKRARTGDAGYNPLAQDQEETNLETGLEVGQEVQLDPSTGRSLVLGPTRGPGGRKRKNPGSIHTLPTRRSTSMNPGALTMTANPSTPGYQPPQPPQLTQAEFEGLGMFFPRQPRGQPTWDNQQVAEAGAQFDLFDDLNFSENA